MKTTILNILIMAAIMLIIGIAIAKAIPRELHRQQVACETMQRNGYGVRCQP